MRTRPGRKRHASQERKVLEPAGRLVRTLLYGMGDQLAPPTVRVGAVSGQGLR